MESRELGGESSAGTEVQGWQHSRSPGPCQALQAKPPAEREDLDCGPADPALCQTPSFLVGEGTRAGMWSEDI